MTNTNKKGSKRMASEASLIPMADAYLEHNMNIMLIGLHGTGKTQSIFDLAKEKGLKVKYYSCSTLDPYTDLVGVPVPKTDENGRDYLQMVRPREVDEAELIFFDEFNRADAKTINAVFEIIQFKSINGEPLPNLRCCWAAMNPPDKEYNVEELDPALLDRFDAFIEIKPSPSVRYMTDNGLPQQVAKALKSWFDEHNRKKRDFKDYVSPRRLEKIGKVYMATGNREAVKYALPPDGNFDINKLIYNLDIATGKKTEDATNTMGTGANPNFKYAVGGLMSQRKEVIDYLKANQQDFDTHKKIMDTISKASIGADTTISSFDEILENIQPSLVEGWFNGLTSSKKSQIRSVFQTRKQNNKTNLPGLESILGKGARTGDWNNATKKP